MKQSLTPDCSRFLVFDFNGSQALLCFLSVMYSCNCSLFHRDKILNPIQARHFKPFNPVRAGVFCYYIGWGHIVSPSISPLFVVQLPTNLASQFSETKSLKGSKSQIHNDVTMTSMTSSLLC